MSRIIGPDHKKDSKAISQFIDKALAHEDIVLKSKGNQLYSYCYISDIVSAILLLMSSGESGNAYNISSDFDGKTLGDYAHFIAHLSNNNVIYDIEINSSVSKATYAILDCTKIKSLGWHAKYSACDAITRTYFAKRIG